MDELSTSQRAALSQVLELTGDSDSEVAIGVLSSVDWDVPRAADLIFGNPSSASSSAPNPAPRAPAMVHAFEFDDSQQDGLLGGGGGTGRPPPGRAVPLSTLIVRPILSLISFPFHLLSSVLRFILGVLRVPFRALRFSGLNFYSPLRPRPNFRGGGGGPDRWLRELEEETGAVSIARLKAPRGVSSSLGSDAIPSSSSTLTSRGNAGLNGIVDDGRKLLPDFTLSTYEEALKTCQRDIRIACVILVSEEHDDVSEFKRSTLTDNTFVRALHNNDILVWGGDVRDREAWSAAEKLQATSYPFVAFLALQPRRNVGGGHSPPSRSSPPSLTVLSRHQGKSTPAGSPTSAQTLVDHIDNQVLPRVTSYLDRLRATQRERERDRQLREDQDRAFADAARRDKERIESKIAAEKAEREARRRAEEEREVEELRLLQEELLAQQRRELRQSWRRWTRRFVRSEVVSRPVEKGLRVAVRLPDGENVVHQFSLQDDLTTLYAFVDAQLVPADLGVEEDPTVPPGGVGGRNRKDVLQKYVETHDTPGEYWGFVLASSFPRIEIPWESGVELSTIPHLKGGGQLVVELIGASRNASPRRSASDNSGDDNDDDDGYKTEEDDD